MSNGTRNVFRICTLCDGAYRSGEYASHASVHVPLRKGRQGRPAFKDTEAQVRQLLSQGKSQSDVARLLGVSRQRVHQIAHRDPSTGRPYRADAQNGRRRQQRREEAA